MIPNNDVLGEEKSQIPGMTRWTLNLRKSPPPRRAEARRPSPPRKSAGGGMEQASREVISAKRRGGLQGPVRRRAPTPRRGATAQCVRRWSAGNRGAASTAPVTPPLPASRRAGRDRVAAFRRSTATPDGRRFRRLPPKASGRTGRPRNLRPRGSGLEARPAWHRSPLHRSGPRVHRTTSSPSRDGAYEHAGAPEGKTIMFGNQEKVSGFGKEHDFTSPRLRGEVDVRARLREASRVRGPIHGLGLALEPPHPARKGAPTPDQVGGRLSPRRRGEVEQAAPPAPRSYPQLPFRVSEIPASRPWRRRPVHSTSRLDTW